MSAPTNVQTAGSGANGTSLALSSYTVPTGTNKRLVVALHLWYPNNAVLPTSVTMSFGGTAMTLQKTSTSNNAGTGMASESCLYVYDMILGATTPNGSISATWVTTVKSLMFVMTIADVDQSATPASVASQTLGPDAVASVASSTVLDFVSNDAQNAAGNFSVAAASGQTQAAATLRANASTAAEGSLGVSSANAPGAATTSMGWTGTMSAGPRSQHIVMAYPSSAYVPPSGGGAANLLLMGVG